MSGMKKQANGTKKQTSSMKRDLNQKTESSLPPRERHISKKDQIISLYTSGIGSVEDLAMITGARPSYVASVLQAAGLISGYFDLYTTTAHPMNVYSKFFAGKLGFKNEEAAQQSVELIDRLYHQFKLAGDRAGQHHALMMALTMFDRARWTRKESEAELFRQWLLARLNDTESDAQPEEEMMEESDLPVPHEMESPETRPSSPH
jgi:hypothetical protein